MKTFLTFLAVATSAMLLVSCNKSENGPIAPSPETSFIANGSFESGGSPSLDGWSSSSDTSSVKFTPETVMGGGGYSLNLRGYWQWPGMVWTRLHLPVGTYVYRLSIWAKADPPVSNGAGGTVRVSNSNPYQQLMLLRIDDTTWTYSSVVDTITTSPSDSLFLGISAGPDWDRHFLVDLCAFERLE